MATEVPRPGQPVPSAPVQSRAQRRHHQLLCRPTVEDPGGTKNVPVRSRGSEAQVAFHHASQSRRSLSFTERQITASRGSGALITSGRCRRRPVPCGCFRPFARGLRPAAGLRPEPGDLRAADGSRARSPARGAAWRTGSPETSRPQAAPGSSGFQNAPHPRPPGKYRGSGPRK